MRIFIGIKLNDMVLEKIEKFLKPFKKISTPLKWTKQENLHITLKFIGEVSPEQYSHIETLLNNTNFNTGAMDLNITGCGKFGRGRDLNILWIGTDKNDTLEDMYNRMENTLEKAGIAKERREFKPHITAARNKKPFNFKSFFKKIDENSEQFISGLKVTHFQVFKSQLTPEGPIYTILKEISLVTG
jgi:2'-5' RNA ligase